MNAFANKYFNKLDQLYDFQNLSNMCKENILFQRIWISEIPTNWETEACVTDVMLDAKHLGKYL